MHNKLKGCTFLHAITHFYNQTIFKNNERLALFFPILQYKPNEGLHIFFEPQSKTRKSYVYLPWDSINHREKRLPFFLLLTLSTSFACVSICFYIQLLCISRKDANDLSTTFLGKPFLMSNRNSFCIGFFFINHQPENTQLQCNVVINIKYSVPNAIQPVPANRLAKTHAQASTTNP